MKRYIILTYTGADITPEIISTLGGVLKANGATTEAVHGVCLDESEVCSILVKHVSPEAPKEPSLTESACIYVSKRFGNYFNNGLKLTLALSEAVINNPGDKTLTNAIEVLARGVATRIAVQYGITKEVTSVFKQINQSLKDVQN